MPMRSLGLSDESSMQLDRYVKEKVIAVVSKEINKDEWGDDPILLLKSYQNQMRADIKDLWIQWDRHTEEINKIKKTKGVKIFAISGDILLTKFLLLKIQ